MINEPTKNPHLARLIAEARAKTARLLAEQELAKQNNNASESVTAFLPPANELVSQPIGPDSQTQILTDSNKDSKQNDIVTINGRTFNPYVVRDLVLNKEQRRAVDLALEGKSYCLIGPAGSGKTTTTYAIVQAIILSGKVPIIPHEAEHKYIRTGTPGIYGGSFTRIATRNLYHNMPDDIKPNIHTIHRALEFEPFFEDVTDEKTGKTKTIRIFRPTRTKHRKLSSSIKVFLMDEYSMTGWELDRKLQEAVHEGAQFIYIGDIAQLPPVMDKAAFGFKMLEFPVVELTEVYRHAGAIVNLANYIRIGKTIPEAKEVLPYNFNLRKLPKKLIDQWFENDGWKQEDTHKYSKEEDGSKVTIARWKNRLDGEVGQLRAMQNLGLTFFPNEIKAGNYNPLKHIILIPYNVGVGSIELNKYIASYLGKERKAEVFEIIAGFIKHYLAVGDKVFFEREESIITKINRNGIYGGKLPQKSSVTLDRWGHDTVGQSVVSDEDTFDSIDALLNINIDEDEERRNSASHVIYMKKLLDIEEDGYDNAKEYSINTAGEVNSLLMGYALTIHKSQGSQWEKVYCVFHNSHNRNLQRELLYTAITRAQKELYVICEPETFIQGVNSQHIVGNTLAEKAEYFKGEKIKNDKRNELFNNNDEGE